MEPTIDERLEEELSTQTEEADVSRLPFVSSPSTKQGETRDFSSEIKNLQNFLLKITDNMITDNMITDLEILEGVKNIDHAIILEKLRQIEIKYKKSMEEVIHALMEIVNKEDARVS
ncbi:MAG: hypothetical protein UW24_C0005G0020 [Parcubacteria group bacterium GW2011_GWA2_44_12]|nr:MAG: hypothetical protein UW24_C0005G0020 [Parcubacteria group bacterium GW2011_GWA2_44_12]